jgi:transcriptional regulator with XRE-family HTH domain
MVFGNLDYHYLGKPNDFTRDMGELVKRARIEAGISQDELAKRILTRQATVSDWENGKVEVSSNDLIYLSHALGKPITYFFPEWSLNKLNFETMSLDIQNLLLYAQKLSKEDLRKLLVQVKALAELSETNKPNE